MFARILVKVWAEDAQATAQCHQSNTHEGDLPIDLSEDDGAVASFGSKGKMFAEDLNNVEGQVSDAVRKV